MYLEFPTVNTLPQHFDRTTLKSLIPSRPISETQWKRNDVLRAYLSEAYWRTGRKAWKWKWNWNESDFNQKYKQFGSDPISPAMAVRAALLNFYLENKADIIVHLPSSR